MTARIVVGHYLTASGQDGAKISRDERGRYSYTGKWGAGSGHSFETMALFLNGMLRAHPRHSISIEFWSNAK